MNIVQLSPTVQATKSNYTQVHKGKIPVYLEYFVDRAKSEFLVDQLQTEQGARFLRKRNRNMIVEVHEDIPLHDDFCWLTLGQIKRLLRMDNFVNMDARSVLACVPICCEDAEARHGMLASALNQGLDAFSSDLMASMVRSEGACHSLNDIMSWFTGLKARSELSVERIPLKNVSRWTRTGTEIVHDTRRFFSVIAVSVQAGNREVKSWTQPLVKSHAYGLIGFIAQKRNGVLHFLVQAKVESGNFDIIDMAPTVSCSEAEWRFQQPDRPHFLDVFMNASPDQIRYSAIQSEEGGRFYHFQNRYMVVELDESETVEVPERYIWMTLAQMIEFERYGYLNIEARGLLACATPL